MAHMSRAAWTAAYQDAMTRASPLIAAMEQSGDLVHFAPRQVAAVIAADMHGSRCQVVLDEGVRLGLGLAPAELIERLEAMGLRFVGAPTFGEGTACIEAGRVEAVLGAEDGADTRVLVAADLSFPLNAPRRDLFAAFASVGVRFASLPLNSGQIASIAARRVLAVVGPVLGAGCRVICAGTRRFDVAFPREAALAALEEVLT